MMGSFSHVFASGLILLLATTTITFVHPAAAYSSELTDAPVTDGTAETDVPVTSDAADVTESPATGDSFAAACFAKIMACTADETCESCLPQESTTTANQQCGFNTFIINGDCGTGLDFACCLDDLSESECLVNEAFDEYLVCGLEYLGCSVDEITCDGAESTTEYDAAAATLGPASTVLALSSAFVILLPFLWV